MGMMSSKHCPVTDLRALKNDYTLSEVIEIKQWIEINDAMEAAAYKDSETKK